MAKKYIQEKLIAGENITIAADGKTISATGGSGGVTKEYVDTAVAGEATRASNKENAIEAKVTVIEDTYATQYQVSQKVDRNVTEDNGAVSTIDNQKGQHGAVMQSNFANTIASISTNDADGESGILAQIYAKKKDTNVGTRINVTQDKIYYTRGKSDASYTANDEIATKGDIVGGGGDIELKSYDLVYDTTAEAYIADFDEATYNKMKEGKVALNLVFKASGMTLFTGTLSDYYYLVGNNSIRGNILINGGVTTTDMNTFMNVTIGHDGVGYIISAKPVSQMDGKTIVKNTDGTYKTLIGGYMEEGLVPGEIIAYELALNKLAENPKVWFVGSAESLMAVGDTITAKVLDQETGNSWTITNATATTYNIEGTDHIGVQLSMPKAGTVEFYVLNWVIDGEETVVVYNNDSTIELHEGAIITAHKMTQGQIPHPIDPQFIPVDGTSIVVQDGVLKAVPEVSAKEFEMLSEEVANKQDDLTQIDGYDETKAQVLEHDKFGKFIWVDK